MENILKESVIEPDSCPIIPQNIDHSGIDEGGFSKVTLVTVTYNSSSVLAQMLNSISENVPVEVIVVDNGSNDIKATRLIVESFGARLLVNQYNKGFGTACNQGAKLATSEFLFFLNPDTIIHKGTIARLIDSTTNYPQASAFNPAMQDSKGRQLFRRSSKIDPLKRRLPKGWPLTNCEVPILSGAALLVRKSAFDRVGGFDEAIFLYHEDDDLCLRLELEYGPLVFIRDVIICHLRGNSSGFSQELTYIKARNLGSSRVYASRKHGVPLAFLKAIIPALVKICLLFPLFSERQRVKTFGYLRGVLELGIRL